MKIDIVEVIFQEFNNLDYQAQDDLNKKLIVLENNLVNSLDEKEKKAYSALINLQTQLSIYRERELIEFVLAFVRAIFKK